MKVVLPISLAILSLTCLSSCLVIENEFSALPPGPWRGVLKLDYKPVSANPKGEPLPEKMNLQFEEVSQGELPFNFELVYDSPKEFHLEIINGEERIEVRDISIGRDRSTAKDTLIINFPVYDSYIQAIYEEDIIEGSWVVNNRGTEYRIPFVARHGKDHRFTTLRKKPVMDVSGEWAVNFEGSEKEDPYPAIAEFKQDGNMLTGTFRTETGDYRYLAGSVQANKLYLSCFDGAHAFLFEAKIRDDSTLIGSFRSGKHYRTLWSAKRDPDFQLTSPDELTYLREGYDRFDFSFPDGDGNQVSPYDEAYQGQVRIVQIMGTWCPNCRDETLFLQEYMEENPSDELAVISLAFERHRDEERAWQAIHTFQDKMNVEYPVLLAGHSKKLEAAQALPMLNEVVSYPTMIIMDKQGEVRRVHTGFSGPATSEYDNFKKDFDQFIQQLLNE